MYVYCYSTFEFLLQKLILQLTLMFVTYTFYCSSIALILPHLFTPFLLLIIYIVYSFYFHNNFDGTK